MEEESQEERFSTLLLGRADGVGGAGGRPQRGHLGEEKSAVSPGGPWGGSTGLALQS